MRLYPSIIALWCGLIVLASLFLLPSSSDREEDVGAQMLSVASPKPTPFASARELAPLPVDPNNPWVTLKPRPLPQEEGAAVGFTHNGLYQIWTAGGFPMVRQTFVYYPHNDSWVQGPSLPVPLHHVFDSLVYHDGKVWLIGGIRHDEPLDRHDKLAHFPMHSVYVCDLAGYNTKSDNPRSLDWKLIKAPMVGGFTHCTRARPHGESMYCFAGGGGGFFMGQKFAYFLRLDLKDLDVDAEEIKVLKLPVIKAIKDWSHVSIVFSEAKQEVLIVTGRTATSEGCDDIWAYSIADQSWRKVGVLTTTHVGDTRPVVHPRGANHVYLLGSENPEHNAYSETDDIVKLNLETYESRIISSLPTTKAGMAVVLHETLPLAYVIGGLYRCGVYASDDNLLWSWEREEARGPYNPRAPFNLVSATYRGIEVTEYVRKLIKKKQPLDDPSGIDPNYFNKVTPSHAHWVDAVAEDELTIVVERNGEFYSQTCAGRTRCRFPHRVKV